MFFDVRAFLRESLALSHETHYLQILLAPNVDRFCVNDKYSPDTSWCDMSFYLPLAERNNHNVLFLLFIRCNLYSDFVSVIVFFPNLLLVIILEPDLPLELVSAIFIKFLFFRQMIALHKLWKMLFISSKKLFSFSSYSIFCISSFPLSYLSAIALEDDQR